METGVPTLNDIIDSLARPGRDPRSDLAGPIFKKDVLKMSDLTPGMELRGTILNVVDFGAFVDVGLKESGLVHVSQLSSQFVRSPHDVVSVGDIVTVWVLSVDAERKRVSLGMIKPGTPAPARGRRPERKPAADSQPAAKLAAAAAASALASTTPAMPLAQKRQNLRQPRSPTLKPTRPKFPPAKPRARPEATPITQQQRPERPLPARSARGPSPEKSRSAPSAN